MKLFNRIAPATLACDIASAMNAIATQPGTCIAVPSEEVKEGEANSPAQDIQNKCRVADNTSQLVCEEKGQHIEGYMCKWIPDEQPPVQQQHQQAAPQQQAADNLGLFGKLCNYFKKPIDEENQKPAEEENPAEEQKEQTEEANQKKPGEEKKELTEEEQKIEATLQIAVEELRYTFEISDIADFNKYDGYIVFLTPQTNPDATVAVERTYSQFVHLHNELVRRGTQLEGCPFPEKVEGPESKASQKKLGMKLMQWLRKIISVLHKEVTTLERDLKRSVLELKTIAGRRVNSDKLFQLNQKNKEIIQESIQENIQKKIQEIKNIVKKFMNSNVEFPEEWVLEFPPSSKGGFLNFFSGLFW